MISKYQKAHLLKEEFNKHFQISFDSFIKSKEKKLDFKLECKYVKSQKYLQTLYYPLKKNFDQNFCDISFQSFLFLSLQNEYQFKRSNCDTIFKQMNFSNFLEKDKVLLLNHCVSKNILDSGIIQACLTLKKLGEFEQFKERKVYSVATNMEKVYLIRLIEQQLIMERQFIIFKINEQQQFEFYELDGLMDYIINID